MKRIYFETLDFETWTDECGFFVDLGYVNSLVGTTRNILETLSLPSEEKFMVKAGINVNALKNLVGGHCLSIPRYPEKGMKTSWIYYRKDLPAFLDTVTRAHEETHAICQLGLLRNLEHRVGFTLEGFDSEEDFCDAVGLYAAKKRNIKALPFVSYLFSTKAIETSEKI